MFDMRGSDAMMFLTILNVSPFWNRANSVNAISGLEVEGVGDSTCNDGLERKLYTSINDSGT